MAASVLIACGLNEQKLPRFIHFSEESGADGSFLISCILGHRVRITNAGTILVCLHHTFNHYLNAGIRLGYNLTSFKGKNLRVIEPVSTLVEDVYSRKPTEPDTFVWYIWKEILKELKELQVTKSINTIIIDDLSVLVNLGVKEHAVLSFCKQLESLQEPESNHLNIITKLNTSDIYDYMSNNLKDQSTVHLAIEKLKSGNFRDVDGRIIVNKYILNGICLTITEKTILYKVNDKNVKIFNSGEVGVKI